jgi:hypothetical protein
LSLLLFELEISPNYVFNCNPKALFASLEGRGGNGFEKKEETSGRNREVWKGMSMEGYLFFIT